MRVFFLLVAVAGLGCKSTTASFPAAEVVPTCRVTAEGSQTVIVVAFASNGQAIELAGRHRLVARVGGGEERPLLPFKSEIRIEGTSVIEEKVSYEIQVEAQNALELGFGTNGEPARWASIGVDEVQAGVDATGEPRFVWGQLPVTLTVEARCELSGRFIVRRFSTGPGSVPLGELVPPATEEPAPCGPLRLDVSWQSDFHCRRLA